MPAPKPSVKSAPKDDPLATENVLRAARGIKTVRSPWLATILRVLPWLALIVALVILYFGERVGAPGPQIFGTGVVTVVIVLLAFQGLLARVPQTLAALWRRKLILSRSNTAEEEQGPAGKQSLNPQEHAEKYLDYVNEFERLLNNRRGQLGMVIAFEILVNLWLGFLNPEFWYGSIPGRPNLFLRVLELIFDMAVAALLAPMAWRLIIIGLQISRLPVLFDLKVQFEHPDQCGGLEPLGNLCLWNILIISLPLVFLGGWLLIAQGDTSGVSFYETTLPQSVLGQATYYAEDFTLLLGVLVPFTMMGFILPLWNTHRVMVEKRERLLTRLDEHVENITNEWNAAVDQMGNLTTTEGNEKLARLEFARQIYQRQKRLPVWPINLNIFLKFASTQAIPWLSLSGLGPGLIKLLGLIIDFVTSSS